ncbi:hypothetical protein PRNP1_000310 [Phytophthora ramorum]
MEEEDVAAVVANGGTPLNRRRSLASQMEEMASDGAFLRAIEHKSPQIDVCRAILRKPTGKRTLEDIHVLKSLFASSKLLDFFSNLDAFKLDRLYQSLEIVVHPEKGVYVFHEGDDGDSFYLVYSGRVEVVKNELNNPARPNGIIHLTFLSPGDTFGERALLSNTDVRAASVVVVSAPTELVLINRVVFSELLKESHDSSANTLEITKRFRSNKDIVRNIFMRSSAQRSEKDLKFAVEYLKSVKFFSRFSFEVRKQLCKVMRLISAVTNTVLFAEGQVGRHFYIIFTGCVDVSVHAKNRFEETKESVVSRLGEGDYFGELALSQADGVRRATVMCTEFCELLVLGRDEYEPLIKKYQNEYHAQYAQMLRKNPYFIGPEWDDNTIEGMCSVMTEKYIPFKGEICKQGSRAGELFIVTRGECRIINEGKHPITDARQIYELGRYGPNSVLGCAEASAGKFNDIFIREYSILAESPMKILVLSRFDIFHLMSSEARASLQRSSNGYIRESIQSRALKSVAWEKYKKTFITSVMAESLHQPFGYIGGRPDKNAISQAAPLGKSQSAPLLPLNDYRTLVDPGSLMLERRGGVTKLGATGTVRSGNESPKESKKSNPDELNRTTRSEEAPVDDPPASTEGSSAKERSSSLPQDNRDILKFTRFRIFGKFRDVDDALNLFRQICAVEKTPKLSEGQDCSRFAVYKEDEMTMALENFPSVDIRDAGHNQFSAADLSQATGQRFACVSVSLQSTGASCIESIVVHVYQCFPTPQSAVRFARQVAATLLAPSALSIVPLFEWIALAELERFDARNNDLEQELELAMRRGGQESTWKARKEALKKGTLAMAPRTAVTLNIYDLVEANEFIAPLGLGIFHSGIEIAGEEFSYASGAGIFSSSPKQAPGAKFRESVAMGFFDGSFQEAHRLAYSLSSDFEGGAYNLFTKNCNSYADALCQLLLGKPIPAYVNRAAYLGSFLSCLMPADLADQAPVGDPNTPSRLTNGSPQRSDFVYTPFAGSGQSMGSTADSSVSSESSSLADRREKVRLAALRRMGEPEQ